MWLANCTFHVLTDACATAPCDALCLRYHRHNSQLDESIVEYLHNQLMTFLNDPNLAEVRQGADQYGGLFNITLGLADCGSAQLAIAKSA